MSSSLLIKKSLFKFFTGPVKTTCLKQHGFTMIELIIVIVILSILSIGSVQFISYSAQGYVDTVRRSVLSSTATIVNEKISRALRDALPNSIRVNADQSCVEFIPIVSASRYVQAPIVGNPDVQTEVHAVPLDGSLTQTGFLAIYPVVSNINVLYDSSISPGVISSLTASITSTSAGADVFTFSGAGSFQFLQASPQNRLYVTAQPQAFCQVGTELFYYRNYGFVGDISNLNASLPSTVPNRLLVANNLLTSALQFSYVPSSLRRNAIVSYELTLQESSNLGETLVVNQEVQVRNVP